MSRAPLTVRIAFVFPELNRLACLRVRALAAALRADGHRPALFSLCSPNDFEHRARTILQFRPDAIVLHLVPGLFGILSLSLPKRIRDLGYTKTIVATELPTATDAANLLATSHEMDCVLLRPDALSIVRLAHATISKCRLVDVPGIIARHGDHLVEGPVSEEAGCACWPWRGPCGLPQTLGLPTALLSTSPCDCRMNTSTLDDSLVSKGRIHGSKHRRSAEDIVDEMASLAFEHGARVFDFADATFLPDAPDEALSFLHRWQKLASSRRLPPFAVSISLYPEQVTQEICTELVNVGVVHASLRVRALSKALHRRIEGRFPSVPGRIAIGRLCRLSIASNYQSMILSPHVSLREVCGELDVLDATHSVPFELTRSPMLGSATHDAPRPTTTGPRTASVAHILGACTHRTHAAFANKEVAALDRWMSCIPTRRTGSCSPARRVADLVYRVVIAQRFFEHAHVAPVSILAARLVSRVNSDQVATVQALATLLLKGNPPQDAVDAITAGAIRQDHAIINAICDVSSLLDQVSCSCLRDGAHVFAIGTTAAGPSSTVQAVEPRLPAFELDVPEPPTEIAASLARSDIIDRCAAIACRDCLHRDPAVSFDDDAVGERPEANADAPFARAIVQVSPQGRCVLIDLVGKDGSVGRTDPAFVCVANMISRHDMSSMAGEMVTYEESGMAV